jgi:hypothetical protein
MTLHYNAKNKKLKIDNRYRSCVKAKNERTFG